MDGGSVVYAGAINAQFILNIVTPAHPCARDIQFILNIKTRQLPVPL
ncbi:MAG: hypothetical protein ACI9KN_000319 [Gammaproteobacteria bacterium]|jgi:hypothetical protein